MKLCLYCSYSKYPTIANYVKDYLSKLIPFHDRIILITNTREINSNFTAFLEQNNIQLLYVKNEGYDFGMWYKVLQTINITSISQLSLINDSCIPVRPFNTLFDWINQADLDYLGLTDSYQRGYYLQSYFLVIKDKAIKTVCDYFQKNGIQKNYADVVRVYEYGLSQHLLKKGFNIGSYFSAQKYNSADISIDCAAETLKDGNPLLKKKLITQDFRDYQRYRLENISFNFEFDYLSLIKQFSNNDTDFLLENIHGNKLLKDKLFISIITNNKLTHCNYSYQNFEVVSPDSVNDAKGEYLFFLEKGAQLTNNALYLLCEELENAKPDLLYSDDILIKNETLQGYHHKSAYNPDMLWSYNYIGSSFVLKKSLYKKITGNVSCSVEEILLQACQTPSKVAHLPKALIKKQVFNGNSYKDYDSQDYNFIDVSDHNHENYKNALSKNLKQGQTLIDGPFKGIHYLKYSIKNSSVTVFLNFEHQAKTVENIKSTIAYANIELCSLNHLNKHGASGVNYFESLKELSNDLKEHVLILNQEITEASSNWLEPLLEHSQRPEIGIVGGLILSPDDFIVDGYQILNLLKKTVSPERFQPLKGKGYFFRPHLIQSVSALNNFCYMLKSSLFLKILPNEQSLSAQYLCKKSNNSQLRNIYTPLSKVYIDKNLYSSLETNYEASLKDPYYNPNLSLTSPYNTQSWSYKYGAAVGSRELLKLGLDNLYQKIGKVKPLKLALLGAGQHTLKLLKATSLSPHSLECIFDENPKLDNIASFPIKHINEFNSQEIDAIVVSSDTMEELLIQRLLDLNISNTTILSIYSDTMLTLP